MPSPSEGTNPASSVGLLRPRPLPVGTSTWPQLRPWPSVCPPVTRTTTPGLPRLLPPARSSSGPRAPDSRCTTTTCHFLIFSHFRFFSGTLASRGTQKPRHNCHFASWRVIFSLFGTLSLETELSWACEISEGCLVLTGWKGQGVYSANETAGHILNRSRVKRGQQGWPAKVRAPCD